MDTDKYIASLTDRYVYDVARRLDPSQRADIEKELRGLIDDMLGKKTAGRDPARKDIEDTLQELGRPAEIAARYRGEDRNLIKPEYIDIYTTVLKFALAAAGIGIAVAAGVEYIKAPPADAAGSIIHLFTGLVSGLLQAFGIVTLIFTAISKFGPKDTAGSLPVWDTGFLPEVPSPSEKVGKAEPIVAIVITVLFAAFINAAPQVFSIYTTLPEAGMVRFPLFDAGVLGRSLLLLDISLALGVIRQIVLLATGRYNWRSFIAYTAAGALGLGFSLAFILYPGLWNSTFPAALNAVSGIPTTDIAYWWGRLPGILAGAGVISFAIDTVVTTWHTWSAGREKG